MLEFLYPKEYVESAYIIDYKDLYAKGYRGILFDIDNTLVRHGAPASKSAIALFKELREIGFKTCLISNNREHRVKPFADKVESPYLFDARKPLSDNFIKSMFIMQTNLQNTLFIGDQIFTDICGANRASIYSVLVKPINPKEDLHIVLKRYFERIVLYFYKKRKYTF